MRLGVDWNGVWVGWGGVECGVVVWCGVVRCGAVRCGGVVWCGVMWCDVVWCGVVWRGVAWCGVGAVGLLMMTWSIPPNVQGARQQRYAESHATSTARRMR